MQQQWPLVTVNILAYNRRDIVRVTLDKVTRALDYPRDRLEIIVVDNESSDGTKEMLAADYPDVQVIVIPKNRGVSAWNEGFKAGTGDYFLVLDDDCYIEGDSLKRAVENARAQNADLVSFLVASPYEAEVYFNHLLNTGILEFWGCSALISRRAIEKLKGFDPNILFLSHELEFTMRLLDAGFKHLYLPEVVSWHMKPPQPDAHRVHGKTLKAQKPNLAYIAGKLLQPRDARGALLHMLLKTALAIPKRPMMAGALPQIVTAFRRGARQRQPVRPEVSRVYHSHFVEFINPLRLLGSKAKVRRFYSSRPRFYPSGKATLQL